MRTQYDGHGKVKKVLLSANEVSQKWEGTLPLTKVEGRKVLHAYFKMVQETVLAGYEWKFPDGSTLSVQWERSNRVAISKYKRGADDKRIPVMNVRRINERYSFCWEGGAVSEKRYRFHSAGKMRNQLAKILYNSDQQYRVKQ